MVEKITGNTYGALRRYCVDGTVDPYKGIVTNIGELIFDPKEEKFYEIDRGTKEIFRTPISKLLKIAIWTGIKPTRTITIPEEVRV